MSELKFKTLCELFLERERTASPSAVYLRYKPDHAAPYQSITYSEFALQVRRLFKGLAELGIQSSDRIAILSESRPEWLLTDFAAMMLGAITVPMFPTLAPAQIEHVVRDSGSCAIVVSNEFQLSKVRQIANSCPELRWIIAMNPPSKLQPDETHANVVAIADIMRDPAGPEFDATGQRQNPRDVVTIIYTSGTTGSPKGVVLTHKNLLANINGVIGVIPTISGSDTALSFLPLNHAFERIASYIFFLAGMTVAFAESSETVAENLLEIRPTIMTAVPRFYERVYSRIWRVRNSMSGPRQRLFDWALRVGHRYGRRFEGEHIGLAIRCLAMIADVLVLKKIRARTGGRIRFFVSGAAALSTEIGRGFAAFGLPIVEGYGMTEAAPIISINDYRKLRWGTVGKPLPNVELRLDTDGEILVRGENVMPGYYMNDAATREMIDADGWLHTGDIGEWDAEQNLRITDRKKHLFVTSGGKNIAPAHIEELLRSSPLVDQVMLIGDHRPFCTALIVPDEEACLELFQQRIGHAGPAEPMALHTVIREEIERELTRLQKTLSSFERVRRFTLIDEPFTMENNLLTPTLKLRRADVERRYARTIDAMYATMPSVVSR